MEGGARWIRFEGFDLDLRTGDLLREGDPIGLQPLPARVLVLLASRPGIVQTRDDIREAIWGEVTFATDQALNTCIRQIRIALQDSATAPRFVATVPKRGYRFAAAVTPVSAPSLGAAETVPRGPGPQGPGRRRLTPIAALLALAVLGAATLTGLRVGANADAPPPASAAPAGTAIAPAVLAPDLRLEYAKARELLGGDDTTAWRGAERSFQRVLDRHPDFAPAAAGAGHAALRSGELARASELATRALALDPGSGEAHLVLGTAHLRRGDWARARTSLERARDLAPEFVGSYVGLAVLAALDSEPDAAMSLAQAAVEVDPMSAITLGDAGYVALWAGRPEQALEWCRHAADVRPDWAVPRYCRLDALHALGDEEAEREQALRIMASLGAADRALDAVRDMPAADGLRRYRSWQRERIDPEGAAPPSLAGYLAFLRMQDGEAESAIRLLRVVGDDDPTRLRMTLLDPVLAPLGADPRLAAALR